MLSIVILSLLILSNFNELYKIFIDNLKIDSYFFSRRNRILKKLTKFYSKSKIIAVVYIKQRIINTYILSIIIQEFSEG